MRSAALAAALCAGAFLCFSASAQAAQPPMGQFQGAYYTCDQGQAFQIGYDSTTPKAATLTTSNNNRQYHLKRTAGADAAQFSNGVVSVSISGNGATVQGTALKLTGCKLKTTT